jgi:AcrR family transcriptional regulator
VITLNGYERRTQQKKELILQAAVEMFLKNGISNTNVSDIAHKAKVSKVTIFKYFVSKENLAREALNSYFSNYMGKFTRILDAKEPFPEKMPKLFSMAKENVTMMGSGLFSEDVWKDPLIQEIYKDMDVAQIFETAEENWNNR